MKRWLLILVVCGMASVGWAALGLAAREEADQKAADEFGSPEAKAHLAQARAMLAATKQIWDAEDAAVHSGGGTVFASNEEFYRWSRRLLEAERALASTKREELAALFAHYKRMEKRYLSVQALFDSGERGGETAKLGAAKYYLAEADLWLATAGGEAPETAK